MLREDVVKAHILVVSQTKQAFTPCIFGGIDAS